MTLRQCTPIYCLDTMSRYRHLLRVWVARLRGGQLSFKIFHSKLQTKGIQKLLKGKLSPSKIPVAPKTDGKTKVFILPRVFFRYY